MRRLGIVLVALALLSGCSSGVEESDAPQVKRDMAERRAAVLDGVETVVPHLVDALGAELVSSAGEWRILSDTKFDSHTADYVAEVELRPGSDSDPPLMLEATAALAEIGGTVAPEISARGSARGAPLGEDGDVVVRLEEVYNDPDPRLSMLVLMRGDRIAVPRSIASDQDLTEPEGLRPEVGSARPSPEPGPAYSSPTVDTLLPLVSDALGGEPAFAFAAVLSCDNSSTGADGVVVRFDDAPEQDEEAAHRALARAVESAGFRPEEDRSTSALTDGSRRLRLDADAMSRGDDSGYVVTVQEPCAVDASSPGSTLPELDHRPVDTTGW